MTMLEKAIIIATKAHRGQKDKALKPYIFHPMRVMLNVSSEDEMICAVLHDVIEDTTMTLEDLREEGFNESIINVLEILTKKENESYDEYIERIIGNKIARIVKIADLKDNMDLSRIKSPDEDDYRRLEKYKKAYHKIRKSLKCYELINCPFNHTCHEKSKCPPHQNQMGCFEYDWVHFYNQMPDGEDKEQWKTFMLNKCPQCDVYQYHPEEINHMLKRLKSS